MHRLLVAPFVTLFLALFSGQASALPGSDLVVRNILYKNGRPTDDVPGEVYELIGWRNCLYVTYRTLDGDQFLDVWDIEDLDEPRFVEEHGHGNSNEDRFANIPVAHLNLPRDLLIEDSHLIYWKQGAGHIFELKANCGLGEKLNVALGGMNRFQYGGNFVSTLKVNRKTGKRHYKPISFQDPSFPLTYSIELEEPFNGAYNGLPAQIKLNRDKTEVTVSTYKQERRSHIQKFWGGILGNIFNTTNGDLTLRQILDRVLSNQYLVEQQGRMIDALIAEFGTDQFRVEGVKKKKKKKKRKGAKKKKKKKKKGKKKKGKKKKKKKKKGGKKKNRPMEPRDRDMPEPAPNDPEQPEAPSPDPATVRSVILSDYSAEDPLEDVLAELGIDLSDSLETAVKLAIEAQIDGVFDDDITAQVMPALMLQWKNAFLALPDLSMGEYRESLTKLLDDRLTTVGLVTYLLEFVLSPLLDDPPYMRYTLGEVMDDLTDNDVARVVDGFLKTFHHLSLVHGLADLAGFEVPACLDIPENSLEFLELLLVRAGPELSPNRPAFYEMLKLVEFYLGNDDFDAFERELDEILREFHELLFNDVVDELVSFLDQVGDIQKTVKSFYESFGGDFSLRPIIAELVARSLLDKVEEGSGGSLNREQILEEVVEDEGLETVGDLLNYLTDREAEDYRLVDLYQRVKESDLNLVKAALQGPVEKALAELFGEIALDTSLNDAIERYILGQLSPGMIADLLISILDPVLTNISGGSLYGVLGHIGLAAQGDCVATWMVAIDAATIIAAVAQNVLLVDALQEMNFNLKEAIKAAIEYIVRELASEFFSQIISNSGGSYRGWYTALVRTSNTYDITDLGGRETRLIDLGVSHGKVALLSREVGFLGALPGEDRQVEILTFNISDPQRSGRKINLGEWQVVNSVVTRDQYLVISGSKVQNDGEDYPTALLVDFTKPTKEAKMITGSRARKFSSVEHLRELRNGQTFGVKSNAGGLILFE